MTLLIKNTTNLDDTKNKDNTINIDTTTNIFYINNYGSIIICFINYKMKKYRYKLNINWENLNKKIYNK